ncbi:MAG: hypothetical protein CVU56_01840 [Deltaproteobacteria bacterium HGW-Deltaproteobacteria-14]|nr:MAG: hypothetical protein CVU56_01840 [Deltaproteobacteria bacterium HGW-Deltaproteobacteria-14]
MVVGKSYDWDDGGGLVFVNPRGVEKRALSVDPRETPAAWTSRYASVTFNQYGRELPNGGMNEAGLVVEVMWLNESRPEARDARPTVNELQWIQLQLDRYASTAEVVAHAREVRVAPVYAAVHWLVCDKGGACAAFETLGGVLVVTSGEALAAPVLTNDTYARSLAALRARQAFGDVPAPTGSDSLSRFVRAAARLKAPGADLVRGALATLDSVRVAGATQWNIVYEPGRGRVHFRTAAAAAVKSLDLADLVTACGEPVPSLDIDSAAAGDAEARFTPTTLAVNQRRVTESFARLHRPGLDRLAELVARYPDGNRCAAPPTP